MYITYHTYKEYTVYPTAINKPTNASEAGTHSGFFATEIWFYLHFTPKFMSIMHIIIFSHKTKGKHILSLFQVVHKQYHDSFSSISLTGLPR